MLLITSLPCEVIAGVLRNLDNVSFLLPSILTCRHFYSSFKENPGLEHDILRRQVTPGLLPYSIAVMEASRLPHPRTAASIQSLLDTLYNEPAQLVAKVQTLPLKTVLKIGHTHDVIESLAVSFASDAWTLLSQRQPGVSGSLVLSFAEYFRFCRAFYRVELYFNLFRGDRGQRHDYFKDGQTQWFFSKHPPWVNEQLACVHDFLEKKLSEASLDVVAHDVDFGEYSIDYLTNGPDNQYKQLWISQGVDFIDKLVKENSYNGKKALLESAFNAGHAYLHDALTRSYEDMDNNDPLDNYSDEAIEALSPRCDREDMDKGPFLAWRANHGYLPRGAWVLYSETTGLRECAYVLWDMERIERHMMLKIFESVPETLNHTYSDEEFDDMLQSFKDRSKIWQRGGSGYWCKDDTSKIIWPTKPT